MKAAPARTRSAARLAAGESPRVVFYMRVSTREQAERNSVEYQRAALLRYAALQRWEVVGVYADEGISGRKASRPRLDELVRRMENDEFDVIAVWRFDRLARSLSHLVRFLERCKNLGIDFVSSSEHIDTSTPLGTAMFQIAGAFAELEANLARERVQAGVDNAKAKGVQLGRPRSNISTEEVLSAFRTARSLHGAARLLGVSRDVVRVRLDEIGVPRESLLQA